MVFIPAQDEVHAFLDGEDARAEPTAEPIFRPVEVVFLNTRGRALGEGPGFLVDLVWDAAPRFAYVLSSRESWSLCSLCLAMCLVAPSMQQC